MSDAIRRAGGSRQPAPTEWFEGRVEFEPVHASDRGVRQLRVHFHDGARTKWHYHEGDQVLYFVEGRGMAEDDQGNRFECEPGDVVAVTGGIRHIHGAAPGHSAVHIAVTEGETVWEDDPRYGSS